MGLVDGGIRDGRDQSVYLGSREIPAGQILVVDEGVEGEIMLLD